MQGQYFPVKVLWRTPPTFWIEIILVNQIVYQVESCRLDPPVQALVKWTLCNIDTVNLSHPGDNEPHKLRHVHLERLVVRHPAGNLGEQQVLIGGVVAKIEHLRDG